MPQNINDIFECLNKKEVDPLAYELNEFLTILSSETKTRRVANPNLLSYIRQTILELRKARSCFDYSDFIKYYIAKENKKYKKFPNIKSWVKKAKEWCDIDPAIPIMFLFWPTTTTNTGIILDKGENNYYGFNKDELIEDIENSTVWYYVKTQIILPFMDKTPEKINKEKLYDFELIIVSSIFLRKKYGKSLPFLFRVWKGVK